MKRQRIASVISTEVQKSTILFINALMSDEIERLTHSSPDSLAATLAASPSMSLVPLAPFLDFARNDKVSVSGRERQRAQMPQKSGRALSLRRPLLECNRSLKRNEHDRTLRPEQQRSRTQPVSDPPRNPKAHTRARRLCRELLPRSQRFVLSRSDYFFSIASRFGLNSLPCFHSGNLSALAIW